MLTAVKPAETHALVQACSAHTVKMCVCLCRIQKHSRVSELRKMPQLSSVALREHMQVKKQKSHCTRAGYISSVWTYSFIQRSSTTFWWVCLLQANIFNMAQNSSRLKEKQHLLGWTNGFQKSVGRLQSSERLGSRRAQFLGTQLRNFEFKCSTISRLNTECKSEHIFFKPELKNKMGCLMWCSD